MALNDKPCPAHEEWANALTHGLGVLLSVAALVVMVVFAALHGTARHVVACALFGSALVVLYLASTLYHALRNPRAKHVLRHFDHAGIFLLIAGTYMPFCLIALKGPWGWTLFGLVVAFAALGIAMKAIFGFKYEIVSATLYLVMGWLALVAIKPLYQALPWPALAGLLAGGAAYSLGMILYASHRLPYAHAWWHLCVLAGSGLHVAVVMVWLIPWR